MKRIFFRLSFLFMIFQGAQISASATAASTVTKVTGIRAFMNAVVKTVKIACGTTAVGATGYGFYNLGPQNNAVATIQPNIIPPIAPIVSSQTKELTEVAVAAAATTKEIVKNTAETAAEIATETIKKEAVLEKCIKGTWIFISETGKTTGKVISSMIPKSITTWVNDNPYTAAAIVGYLAAGYFYVHFIKPRMHSRTFEKIVNPNNGTITLNCNNGTLSVNGGQGQISSSSINTHCIGDIVFAPNVLWEQALRWDYLKNNAPFECVRNFFKNNGDKMLFMF